MAGPAAPVHRRAPRPARLRPGRFAVRPRRLRRPATAVAIRPAAAQAARLLGAEVILSGIRPEVAQTLVSLGTDLSGITTRGTLQSAIAYALGRRLLGE